MKSIQLKKGMKLKRKFADFQIVTVISCDDNGFIVEDNNGEHHIAYSRKQFSELINKDKDANKDINFNDYFEILSE